VRGEIALGAVEGIANRTLSEQVEHSSFITIPYENNCKIKLSRKLFCCKIGLYI